MLRFSGIARVVGSVAVVAALVTVPSDATLLRAAEPAAQGKGAASLAFVPADVSFYQVMLRNREQIEIIAGSKAWAKLKSLPVVQEAWAQVDVQWEGGALSVARQFLSLPENEQMLGLFQEMFSDEVFIYGDPQCAVILDLISEAYNSATYTGMVRGIKKNLHPGEDDESDQTAGARVWLDTLAGNLEALDVPGLVIGFKIKDRAAAQTQLKRLEVVLRMALSQNPLLKNRLDRKKIGDGDFVTLSLDGAMIPWEQVPFDRYADEPGEYDDLAARLKSLTLAISIGLRGDFVLISIAKNNEHLAALGNGELLAGADEFKPLAKFADRRLTSVGYVSSDMVERLGGSPDDLDHMAETVEQLLEEVEVDESLQEMIVADVTALAGDLKPYFPKPGAALAFGFLTPRGIESYQYSWSQDLNRDSSKPLDILAHLGGSPLAAIAARNKVSPEQYALLVKWLQKAYVYVDRLAVPQLKPEDKKQYDKVLATFQPLLERLNKNTSERLLPALADGQAALVFDARLSSKHWFPQWPTTEQALPMAEPALVIGVSDAKLLKQAMNEYFDITEEVIAKVRELNPQAIPPEFKLLRPSVQSTTAGETFAYELPKELGVDPQIVPNAGLNKNTAVLAISLSHTGRLLAAKPLTGEGPLADAKRPLGAAGYLDFAGLVTALTPWIEFGVKNYGESLQRAAAGLDDDDDDDADKPAKKADKKAADKPVDPAVMKQVRDGLSIAKVLQKICYAGYPDKESGANIGHMEVHFQDLP